MIGEKMTNLSILLWFALIFCPMSSLFTALFSHPGHHHPLLTGNLLQLPLHNLYFYPLLM